MSLNQVQTGEHLTVTAPRTVTTGEGVLVGAAMFGVAHAAATSGATMVISTKGVFDLAKQASLAIAAGAIVYWDNTAFECDTTTTNVAIGTCTEAAAGADTTVRVRLFGHASSDGAAALAATVTNAANIATNVTNIATNVTNIATNVTDIATNGTAIADLDSEFVDVVCTFPDATGGGTTSVGTVQLNDRAGSPIAAARVVRVDLSDTQYQNDPATNATAALTGGGAGSVLAGSGTASLLIKTSAAGLCELTITDAIDETIYVSARTADFGVDAAGSGCIVRDCVPDSVAYSA